MGSALGAGWSETLDRYVEAIEGCLLHDALREVLEYVDDANKVVDAEQPWTLAKTAKGDGSDAEAARERLAGVLGDLVEAVRLVALAAAPYMPSIAPRALAQVRYRPAGAKR